MEFIQLVLLALLVLGVGGIWIVRRLVAVADLEKRQKALEQKHDVMSRRLADFEARLRSASVPTAERAHPETIETIPVACSGNETPPTETDSARNPRPVVAAGASVAAVESQPETPRLEAWSIGGASAKPSPTAGVGRRPPPIRATAKPDAFDQLRQYLSNWNPVVLGGSLLVLLGVVFLLGLAAQRGAFPPVVRLAGASALAAALLAMGWRQRLSRPAWALPLQGTGCAILFFAIYSAFANLHLLTGTTAFAGATLVLVFTAALAVVQSSQRMAVLAMGAGFAAPLVFSTGQGNHVGLFSYYVLLNLGVVAMVRLRGWKTLIGIAFVATYGIATTWGVLRFSPDHFASCEIFLWIYYALFSASAVGFALHGDGKRQGVVSGSLVFGLPLATFALQTKLLEGDKILLAWTAAGMCLHHLVVGAWVLRKASPDRQPALKTMAHTLLVLGSILGSIAIPLALSGRWTSLAWAVEGAGLIWLSSRQGRIWNLAMGSILLLAATGIHLFDSSVSGVDASVLVVAFLAAARCLDLPGIPGGALPWVARLSVVAAWCLGARAIHANLQGSPQSKLWIASIMALAAGISVSARIPKLGWKGFHYGWIPAVLAWGLLVFKNMDDANPYADWGVAGWIVAPAVAAWLLEGARRDSEPQGRVRTGLESILLYGTVFVFCGWISRSFPSALWGDALAWTVAAVLLGAFSSRHFASLPWFAARAELRAGPWLMPWVAVLAVASFCKLFVAGGADPLPWIPFANSADLPAFALLAVLLVLPETVFASRQPVRGFIGVFLFIWTTTTLCRGFHFHAGTPWTVSDLWGSRTLQAAWTILLTTQALALCWFASRRGWRSFWILGASLLAVVTIKLLVVDLSDSGSVARIVSFLGAGLLMVGIGFVSPVPPAPDKR